MLLDRIELFVQVARHQSLGKTAREMHVSASSICQRLKCLESEFGAKLYRKNKDGIELTGAGETFLGTASEVVNQLESLKKTLHSEPETACRTLIVGGTYNPSAKYLPGAIAAFRKTHPNTEVRFLTSDGPGIEKAVREGEIEIAILHSPAKSSDFNMEHFAVDHVEFFVHPAHPLAKKRKLDVDNLARTPVIVRDAIDGTDKMLKEIKSRGVSVNIALRCASPDTVKAAVRKKMGIGILFHNLIEADLKNKLFKILRFPALPKLVDDSYIAYSKKKSLSPVACEFLGLLQFIKSRSKNEANVSDTE